MATVSKAMSRAIQSALSDHCDQEEKLKSLAQQIISEISDIDPSGSEGMLETFVSEVVLSASDQRRKRERRQHQMECIAAAKARGVRFGSPARVLPENFDECREAWRSGQMSLRQAAGACGMSHTSFRDAVLRMERTA